MTPTILVVGSTGNTGKSVIRQLPELLKLSKTLSGCRVLGLTRSLESSAAQKLAELPNIEMVEKDWTEIDAEWLREHQVVRVFIASHNQPNQFAEESAFYVALLQAEVKYVVRVSTSTVYVSPTSPVYYGRAHWAIENLLSQPEFKGLQWTSLRPNLFTTECLSAAASWIQQYHKTGKQETFKTNLAEDAAVAIIDPEEVGTFGAHLLALDDPTPHNQAKYVLNGPEDINGKKLVELIEKVAGVKVENVEFKDLSFLTGYSKLAELPEKILSSIKYAVSTLWSGKWSLSVTPTSKEVIELAGPKRTPAVVLKAMLEDY